MTIEARRKMLTGKGGELISRRMTGVESELIKWGKAEGVIEVGDTTEVWIKTIIEIRIVRKPKSEMGIE